MTMKRIALFLMLFMSGVIVAKAQGTLYQVQTRPVRGFMPNMDQLSSPVDHIDPVSRKMHLEIPLASLPQGPGGSGFDLNLVYDTHLWNLDPEPITYIPTAWLQQYQNTFMPGYKLSRQQETRGGWAYNIDLIGLDIEEKIGSYPDCSASDLARRYRVRVRLMDGSTHTMQMTGFGKERNDGYNGDGFMAPGPDGIYHCQTNGTPAGQPLASGVLSYYSDDASYLKLEIDAASAGASWRLYFPDGRRIVAGQPGGMVIYDANGNGIHNGFGCFDQGCTQTYRRIYDDAGHDIKITETGTLFFSEVVTTIETAGPDSNAPLKWTLNWVPFNIGITYEQAEPELPWTNPFSFSTTLVGLKYVQLPLAAPVASTSTPAIWNSYAFGYADDTNDHGFGEVDSVRTPTGATFTYRYELENTITLASKISHENKVVTREVTQPGTSTLLTWTYAGGGGGTTVTNPDTSTATYWWGPPHGNSTLSSGGGVYQIDEPHGKVTKRLWSTNPVYTTGTTQNPWGQNAWVSRETITVGNSSGNPALTTVTDKLIDKNGNLIQTKEYDWVAYSPTGIETGSTLKRVTDMTYHADVHAATDTTSNDAKAYWNAHFSPLSAGQSRKLDAVARKVVSGGSSNTVSITEFAYDEPYRRGNLTTEKRWDSKKASSAPSSLNSSNAQIVTREYDDPFGNLTDIYEPSNNVAIRTHIEYDSSHSFPMKVEYAKGSTEQRTWTYSWNTTAGILNSKTDADNNLTAAYTYDIVGRPKLVIEAGQRQSETTICPGPECTSDTVLSVLVKNDLASSADGKLRTRTEYDILGRPTLVKTRETVSPETWLITETTYQPAANTTIKSSPYRSGTGTTSDTSWVCTQTDSLKRVIRVATFKGPSVPTSCATASNMTGAATTVYDADWTIFTDPAGKVRKERRDGLGRLVEVVEDPSGLNYSTTYSYNTLDNLVGVAQGAQTRTFQYSSLGRLTQAFNPESGTIDYFYWDSGELKSRVDGRPVITDFYYDALHRLTKKIYSGAGPATPTVEYKFYKAGDGAPKVGQLKEVTSDNATSTNDSYDSFGRVTGSHHTMAGNPATFYFSYSYLLGGGIQSVTNQTTGRVTTYTVDDAGRTKTLVSGTTTYANLNFSDAYTPDGRIAKMQLGNGLYETRTYDALVAGTSLTTKFNVGTSPSGSSASDRLSLEYGFSPTQNNGNVLNQIINRPGHSAWSQSYTYDALNRLATAAESNAWWQNYGYDRYGNQWLDSQSVPGNGDSHEITQQSQYVASTNKLNYYNWYDLAGNQTVFSPFTLDYDAENRMVQARENDGHMSTYVYDGAGNRVKRVVTASNVTTTTYYVHNALGQLAAEYSTAASTTSTSYIHTDMLGSTRLVTNQSGAVVECYDYLPFGRMLTSVDSRSGVTCYPGSLDDQPNSKLPEKFTGKQRDPETKLDFFGARYYSGAQGRWLIPDWSTKAEPVPYANLGNPQTLNLYQYVGNNPITIRDVDGHCTALVLDCVIEFGVVGAEAGPYGAIATGILGAGVGLQMWSIAHGGTGGYSAHQLDRPFFNPGKHLAENTSGQAEQKQSTTSGNQSTPASPEDPKEPKSPYKRPSGATTPEQRASVQDKPCVDCGQTAPRMNADHKDPLVIQHYEGGGIDKTKMRQVDAVQPQCPTCSNRQGANLSRYSRQQRELIRGEADRRREEF